MQAELDKLHGVAFLLGSLAHASEKNLGQSSLSICMLAGKKFGREAVEDTEQTQDPARAVEILRVALEKQGIHWDFEPFKGEDESPLKERDGKMVMRLVFRTCMVRNALFRYAAPAETVPVLHGPWRFCRSHGKGHARKNGPSGDPSCRTQRLSQGNDPGGREMKARISTVMAFRLLRLPCGHGGSSREARESGGRCRVCEDPGIDG